MVEGRVAPVAPIVVVIGLAGFGLFSSASWPMRAVGLAGLVISAAVIGRLLFLEENPRRRLGLERLTRTGAWLVVPAAVLGAGLAVWHRVSLGMTWLPDGLWEWFAIMAALVGATEELVYRGWLQSSLAGYGRAVAVIAAALGHATYKTCLFVWPPEPVAGNLWLMGLLTFAGGIVFGTLREAARSVWPAVAAHVVFDLVVYGAVAQAPWWVWA